MNKCQKLLTFIAAIFLLIFVGSSCVQDFITPTYVDKGAAEWAGVPQKMFLPYPSVWDAKRVGLAIDYKLTIERIRGGYYKNITNLSIVAGEELKQVIFSPTGPLGALAVAVPSLAIGALAISKPGDKKKITELEVKNGEQK